MTSKLDEELERLSKAVDVELAAVQARNGINTARLELARLQFREALDEAYRARQLVPAQPSGDVVEAVALSLAEFECANWDAQSFNDTPTGETPDEMRRGYLAKATAAITTYEAVSGVAKMRGLLSTLDAELGLAAEYGPDETVGEFVARSKAFSAVQAFLLEDERARAALGEKP